MFNLTENQFLESGVCKYEDEYGNKVIARRTGVLSFTIKMRFAVQGISMSAVSIDVQQVIKNDMVGVNASLSYANERIANYESVRGGVQNFTNLTSYWIAMLKSFNFTWYNIDDAIAEEMCRRRLVILKQFPEIQPLIAAVFA